MTNHEIRIVFRITKTIKGVRNNISVMEFMADKIIFKDNELGPQVMQ